MSSTSTVGAIGGEWRPKLGREGEDDGVGAQELADVRLGRLVGERVRVAGRLSPQLQGGGHRVRGVEPLASDHPLDPPVRVPVLDQAKGAPRSRQVVEVTALGRLPDLPVDPTLV